MCKENKKDSNSVYKVCESETSSDDSESRGNWENGRQFLLSCIAMSVGLGNLWRFPYKALENGGGAFLVPYFIVLLTIGRPSYYLEMIMGQFSSRSNVKVFDCAPAMRGIGIGQLCSLFMVSTFYATIMAISLRYLVYSFSPEMPWTTCDPTWTFNTTIKCINATSDQTINDGVPSTELYFGKEVATDKYLICFLVASWLIIYLVVVKGVKAFGRVSYITALFPYVILSILLVRVVTLEGAWDGIKLFFTPQWQKLIDPSVWFEAALQCFFSLNIYFACVIMYSSFNKFNHNIRRDSNIISVVDTFTSLLAGVITFGIVGHICHTRGYDMNDINTLKNIAKGPSLAFITYPLAFAKFPFLSQTFTILFFLMFYVLGMGSNLAMISAIVTAIRDEFKGISNWLGSLLYVIVVVAIGSIYVIPGGMKWIDLVDHYGVNSVIVTLAAFEVIAFCHCYGVKRICEDVTFMLGQAPSKFYQICWKYITPTLLVGIIIGFVASPQEGDLRNYTNVQHMIGRALTTLFIAPFPLYMLYKIFSQKADSVVEKFKSAFKPDENWGPLLPENRRLCGISR